MVNLQSITNEKNIGRLFKIFLSKKNFLFCGFINYISYLFIVFFLFNCSVVFITFDNKAHSKQILNTSLRLAC